MSLKQHLARIGLLLLFVGALLGWLTAHTDVLYADGLRYIRQAQSLDRGAWREGLLKAVDQPVYPLEIVAAHRVIGGDSPESWEAAAQWGSVVAGVLLVVPLYLVARELFGERAAWLACLLTYIVPLTGHVFADALSESTFLLFWTWGLWTALRFLREGRFGWLPPTIGLSVLAYLTRPEGLLLPAALVAILGLLPLWRSLRISGRRWWAALGVLVIGPACLVGPYMAVKGGIGTKPSIARLIGMAPVAPPQAVERQRPLDPAQSSGQALALAFKAVTAAGRDAVTLPLIPLAFFGLIAHRGYRAAGRAWLLLAFIGGASVLALVRLHMTGGYCSPRHALVLALVLFAAAASGLERLIAACVEYLAGRGLQVGRRAVGPIAWALALGGLAIGYAPRTLAPLNEGLSGYRAAGQWLREHVPAESRVVDVSGWALFYGDRKGYTFRNYIYAPGDPLARWVVAREAHLIGPWPYCDMLRGLVGNAQPVAVFQGVNPRRPVKVLIFDRQAPKSGAAPALAAPAPGALRR